MHGRALPRAARAIRAHHVETRLLRLHDCPHSIQRIRRPRVRNHRKLRSIRRGKNALLAVRQHHDRRRGGCRLVARHREDRQLRLPIHRPRAIQRVALQHEAFRRKVFRKLQLHRARSIRVDEPELVPTVATLGAIAHAIQNRRTIRRHRHGRRTARRSPVMNRVDMPRRRLRSGHQRRNRKDKRHHGRHRPHKDQLLNYVLNFVSRE